MAVSEKQFAAEIIPYDGEALKFDDIGCLLRYLSRPQVEEQTAAIFVVDYSTREWLEAQTAYYVHSPTLNTPMSSGVIVFKDRANADESAARYQGKVLKFSELPK
jgi:copper chaperone NosL